LTRAKRGRRNEPLVRGVTEVTRVNLRQNRNGKRDLGNTVKETV